MRELNTIIVKNMKLADQGFLVRVAKAVGFVSAKLDGFNLILGQPVLQASTIEWSAELFGCYKGEIHNSAVTSVNEYLNDGENFIPKGFQTPRGSKAVEVLHKRLVQTSPEKGEDLRALYTLWLSEVLGEEAFVKLCLDELPDLLAETAEIDEEDEDQLAAPTVTKSEMTQFLLRVEDALGLSVRQKNGEDRYVKYVSSSHDSGKTSRTVKDYYVKTKDRIRGAKPLNKTPAIMHRALLESFLKEAEAILTARSIERVSDKGRRTRSTIFEGGFDSRPAIKSWELLSERLRLITPEEDPSAILNVWHNAISQVDFMSNERSSGTIRIAKKRA